MGQGRNETDFTGASPVLREVQRPWVSPDPSMNLTPFLPSPVAEHGVRGLAGRSCCPCLGCAAHSPWRRARRCQGWQALRWEHSQGVINNLLSQGGLLGFRITRQAPSSSDGSPSFLLFTLTGTTAKMASFYLQDSSAPS